MRTIKESILSSTKSGKSAYDVTPVKVEDPAYRVNVDMKDWFECVSLDNFRVFVDNAISNSKKYSKYEDWGRESYAAIFFKDGYFEFRFYVQSSNGAIYYTFYFTNTVKNWSNAVNARYKQMDIIDGVEKERLNTFKKTDSNKTAAQRILDYIRRHLNLIEKQ